MNNLVKHIFTIVFLLNVLSAKSQYITIEDTCVLNRLISNHPTLLNSNKQLDASLAANLYSELNLSNSCVSDLSVLKYFPNITSLKLNNNNIIQLDQIQNKGVAYLFLNNNFITDLSPLYFLPKLYQLEISNNKISIFNTPQKSNPINWLYAGKNPITEIKPLDSLTELKGFIISENQLTEFPSVQNLKTLEELHVNNTSIQQIEGLDSLKNLKKLYAYYSKLNSLTGLDSNITLTVLSVHHTELVALPYLSNKNLLTSTGITYNRLTFNDFLKEKDILLAKNVKITPQTPFYLHANDTLRVKDNITFSIPIEQQATGNMYTWYKKDSLLLVSSDPTYSIENVEVSDIGIYSVEITNSTFPNHTITSREWNIEVLPCLNSNQPEFHLLATDCKNGYILDANLRIEGKNSPFSYYIINSLNKDTVFSSSTLFQNIQPGNYRFEIIDSKNCKLSFPITLPSMPDCKNLITPNNDGFQDDFYIVEKGTTIILDKNLQEVIRLQTPASWNGVNKSGQLVPPGYYIIITNDENAKGVNVIY